MKTVVEGFMIVLALLFFIIPILMIVGLIKPSWVLRWGNDDKKTRLNVIKYSLLSFILVIALFAIIPTVIPEAFGLHKPKTSNIKKSEKTTEELFKEADDNTIDYLYELYERQHVITKYTDAYADNVISRVTFYNAMEELEDVSKKVYLKDKNKEVNNYYSSLNSVALSQQKTAEYLLKYLNSYKTEDLSKAQGYIKQAKEGIIIAFQNRVVLLKKANYDESDIEKEINKMKERLNEIDNSY